MIRFYCKEENGYIIAVGIGCGGREIPESEYAELLKLIGAKPAPEEGVDYRLKEDRSWEAYERPPVEETDESQYISDAQALAIVMGGGV